MKETNKFKTLRPDNLEMDKSFYTLSKLGTPTHKLNKKETNPKFFFKNKASFSSLISIRYLILNHLVEFVKCLKQGFLTRSGGKSVPILLF